MHASGGVALLAWRHAVGLEPSVDQRRVRVDLGTAAPVRGRFRRHVVHVGVFRDSGAVHVRPPRDLRPGHSLTVQSPDILPFGHRYRHRPFLPERRRLQPADSFFGLRLGNIQARRAGACFRLGGHMVQFLMETSVPILRKNSAEIA